MMTRKMPLDNSMADCTKSSSVGRNWSAEHTSSANRMKMEEGMSLAGSRWLAMDKSLVDHMLSAVDMS